MKSLPLADWITSSSHYPAGTGKFSKTLDFQSSFYLFNSMKTVHLEIDFDDLAQIASGIEVLSEIWQNTLQSLRGQGFDFDSPVFHDSKESEAEWMAERYKTLFERLNQITSENLIQSH